MTELIKTGKNRTIQVSLYILLVSLNTIYMYNSAHEYTENAKLIQQLVRFLLTMGLLILVYKGKNWAKITSIILFTLGVIGALISLINTENNITHKLPLFVMMSIYSIAIYHFAFSSSFKEFFKYQKDK